MSIANKCVSEPDLNLDDVGTSLQDARHMGKTRLKEIKHQIEGKLFLQVRIKTRDLYKLISLAVGFIYIFKRT